jgi:hypothetical protein
MDVTTDGRALRAAAFLIQALELGDDADPAALAPDLIAVQESSEQATFVVELESSVGPTAFVIYVYSLTGPGADGRAGRDRFDADQKTIETAAALDTPGPRPIAHALGPDEGYILATTPSTLRALTGETDPAATADLEAGLGELLPVGEVAAIRSEAPLELLRLLHAANEEAGRWLAALRAGGRVLPDPAGTSDPQSLELNEVESELALYLLDERSIQSLLRALNLLLTAARSGAANAASHPD